MTVDNVNIAVGDQVSIKRSSLRHMNSAGLTGEPLGEEGKSFSQLLVSRLDSFNDAQTNVNELYQAMLTDPESINSDQLTVAMAEAEMALGLTKAVVDKAVSAYKEIINLR